MSNAIEAQNCGLPPTKVLKSCLSLPPKFSIWTVGHPAGHHKINIQQQGNSSLSLPWWCYWDLPAPKISVESGSCWPHWLACIRLHHGKDLYTLLSQAFQINPLLATWYAMHFPIYTRYALQSLKHKTINSAAVVQRQPYTDRWHGSTALKQFAQRENKSSHIGCGWHWVIYIFAVATVASWVHY